MPAPARSPQRLLVRSLHHVRQDHPRGKNADPGPPSRAGAKRTPWVLTRAAGRLAGRPAAALSAGKPFSPL